MTSVAITASFDGYLAIWNRALRAIRKRRRSAMRDRVADVLLYGAWRYRPLISDDQIKWEAELRSSLDAGIAADWDSVPPPVCYQVPGQRTPTTGKKGWWRKLSGQADTVLTVNGREFPLPRIYEDFLIDVKPKRAERREEVDIVVDLVAMEELILGLMMALRPVKTRLDPWQTAQMTQGLANKTGMDISEILFSNPLQYKRARLFKALLYANMLSFLPNERAERETRRLQRKSETRIDHPDGAGESKDMYDVRAINVWEAAIYGNAELAIHF